VSRLLFSSLLVLVANKILPQVPTESNLLLVANKNNPYTPLCFGLWEFFENPPSCLFCCNFMMSITTFVSCCVSECIGLTALARHLAGLFSKSTSLSSAAAPLAGCLQDLTI
jgi:hypothetical protein